MPSGSSFRAAPRTGDPRSRIGSAAERANRLPSVHDKESGWPLVAFSTRRNSTPPSP